MRESQDISESPPGPGDEGYGRRVNTTRLIAGLLLIPSVPLLLISAAALGLFYIAPTRFNALLERLPGDQILRSALAFGPAVLLALVVLAVLYFLERPSQATVADALDTEPAVSASAPSITERGWLSRAALSALLLLLAISSAAALLAFAMPTRFWDILGALPGQRYLRIAVPTAPIGFAGLSLLAAILVRRSLQDPGRSWLDRVPSLLPVAALGLGLLMLAASVGSLLVFSLRPGRLESLLERTPVEALLRLQLAFAPIVLLAVVMLAALSLFRSRPDEEVDHTDRSPILQIDVVWLASAGLLLALVIGAGLLLGVAFLMIR